MPQSFLTTEGFHDPVMPQVNFADPRLFGGAYPALQAGIQSGVNIGGELQQQHAAAAMLPLQLEHAQNVAAMGPVELEQAKLNLAKSKMPIPVSTGTRPVKINRETGEIMGDEEPLEWAQGEAPKSYKVDPETGELTDQGGQVDANGAAVLGTFQAQRRAVPYDIVEQETGYKVDPMTGEKTPYTKFGKVIETDEERQKREASTEVQGKEAQARVEAAKAASTRAQLGANRTYNVDQPDGTTHVFKDAIDPTTGEVVQRDLGTLDDFSKSKAELNRAKAGQAAATGEHQHELAANAKKNQEVNKTRDAILAKAASAYDLPVDVYVEMTKTVPGRRTLASIFARKTGTSGSTVPSPEEEAGVKEALASAQQSSEATQAPASVSPVITPPFGNALGAPMEDNGEQGVPAAPVSAPSRAPVVHPSPEVYAALPDGAQYIEHGVTYTKHKKKK